MYYVYVLKGDMKHALYIGVTHDLRRRYAQHVAKMAAHTSKSSTWKLVYYEAYRDKHEALERETSLKKFGSAYGHLKKRIQKSIAI